MTRSEVKWLAFCFCVALVIVVTRPVAVEYAYLLFWSWLAMTLGGWWIILGVKHLAEMIRQETRIRRGMEE